MSRNPTDPARPTYLHPATLSTIAPLPGVVEIAHAVLGEDVDDAEFANLVDRVSEALRSRGLHICPVKSSAA